MLFIDLENTYDRFLRNLEMGVTKDVSECKVEDMYEEQIHK